MTGNVDVKLATANCCQQLPVSIARFQCLDHLSFGPILCPPPHPHLHPHPPHPQPVAVAAADQLSKSLDQAMRKKAVLNFPFRTLAEDI